MRKYIKRKFVPVTMGVLVMTTSIVSSAAESAERWQDESVFRVNTTAPHATKMAFPTPAEALTKKRMESPWCMLLNGEWKFHWSPTVEEHKAAAEAFYSPGFDDSAWDTIPVPSNVELQGYGTPIYRNIGYVFKVDPPGVTGEPEESFTAFKDRSPVSAYRRTITVPEGWDGRKVFIVFNGVESAFTLYVNGQEVGYSQDSRTPAEFNITQYLKTGENLLAVEVHRFSDGSYLEDQDFWRLSGIFRDVYLWSCADLDLLDIEIKASLDDVYEKGVLSIKPLVFNYGKDAVKYTLALTLLDASGSPVVEREISGNVFADTVHLTVEEVADLAIEPWSAEQPNLYRLQVSLKDAAGSDIACYAFPVGFIRTEIKDGNLLVNGQPILIKGVNRHDHDHIHGHYIPEETMRAELDLMKQLNINAIRTSHYPNDPRFLELVNEYGFYVISEANLETHGFGNDPDNQLAKDKDWRPAMIDRAQNMVEIFKNQPCIIMWSLGNEAGTGSNLEAMADWIRERDASRLVHYEGANKVDYSYVDIASPMYYRIGSLEEWCREMEQEKPEQQKPMIQCEYSHAMGNSSGGLYEYWDLIRKEPLLQGGFIWDWRDQGILRTKPKPKSPAAVMALDKERFVAEDGSLVYFAYGGDFGDEPNDVNFCMNGVVGADLVPNPHAAEVAYQYRSILTTGVDVSAEQPVIRIFNENFFAPLKQQQMIWTLIADGEPIKKGRHTIDELAPQQSVDVTLSIAGIEVDENAEYFLNVEYLLNGEPAWAPEGHIVARDQIALEWTEPGAKPYQSSRNKVFKPSKSGGNLVFTSGDIKATIDESTGQLISLKKGRLEYLKSPLTLNFWRAPVDNDRRFNNNSKGKHVTAVCKPWREAGAKARMTQMTEQDTGEGESKRMGESSIGDSYTVSFNYDIPVGETKATVTYTFYGDGALGVHLKMEPLGEDLPQIPRIGFQCAITPQLRGWTWYGHGPEENYTDRNTGTFLGLWKTDVLKAWHPYSQPQGTANRTGVRRAAFTAGKQGLMIVSTDGQPLEIEAYPFLQSDIEVLGADEPEQNQNAPRHPADIPLRGLITLSIDHRQMGVGGENSWGAWPRPQHLIEAEGTYEYSFVLKPF
jgi:beta-galactosidase